MNVKKIHFILVFLIFCSISISGTYASASSYAAASASVENHLQTGDINIRLDEYQLNEYLHEEPYVQPEILMPGDMISKIPRITNLAEPCYIRAKITFPSTIDDVIPPVTETVDTMEKNPTTLYCLAEKDLLGISADWVKIQDYYYYRPLLEKEESAVLFQGVRIPEYWDNTYAGAEFFVNIQVEAVQAIHFTPDYTSETPWGNVEPEVCIHSEPYEKPAVGFQTLSVEYEGASKELLATPEDFFTNFTNAMPGDTLTDTILLENTTDRTAEFFFHTEVPDTVTNEQLVMLDEIVMSISVDGKSLYHGNLFAESLSSDISLGSLASGESKKFTFTLFVPTDWTNRYALKDCAVRWIFSVMQEPVSTTPKTGDHHLTERYLGLLLGSVGCTALIGYVRKSKRGNAS